MKNFNSPFKFIYKSYSYFKTQKYSKSTSAVENLIASGAIIEPSLLIKNKIKEIPKLSDFLIDNHNRMHNYLRISLTEKCNLRCQVIYSILYKFI